jgi:hypothetical protein
LACHLYHNCVATSELTAIKVAERRGVFPLATFTQPLRRRP